VLSLWLSWLDHDNRVLSSVLRDVLHSPCVPKKCGGRAAPPVSTTRDRFECVLSVTRGAAARHLQMCLLLFRVREG
jgi:hypothetical protein